MLPRHALRLTNYIPERRVYKFKAARLSFNFTIASTSRVFDKEADEWRDGDTLFLRCTVWQQSAENLADSPGTFRGTR